MIIKCFRCRKDINTPDSHNADYIMASDTVVREPRQVLLALQENTVTKAKAAKMREVDGEGNLKYPELRIDDTEYTRVEVQSFEATKALPDIVKVVAELQEKDIQKTGVICPNCYRDGDFVIWGVHKQKEHKEAKPL